MSPLSNSGTIPPVTAISALIENEFGPCSNAHHILFLQLLTLQRFVDTTFGWVSAKEAHEEFEWARMGSYEAY